MFFLQCIHLHFVHRNDAFYVSPFSYENKNTYYCTRPRSIRRSRMLLQYNCLGIYQILYGRSRTILPSEYYRYGPVTRASPEA